jgi:D-alanine--poly(phosphoribitol) ligase subunit 1
MRNSTIKFLVETTSRFPEKEAIKSKNDSLTFSEVLQFAKNVSTRIGNIDRSINEPIAVLLDKTPTAIASFVGIHLSGNCYCPVDVTSPVLRLKKIIENLRCSIFISSKKHEFLLSSLGINKDNIIYVDEISRTQQVGEGYDRSSEIIDVDPAYIIYTSGSTGTPKGVTVSHRGVIDYISWASECFEVDQEEVIGNQSPFFFDNSTLDIYLCLSTGAKLYLIDKGLFSFPVELIKCIEDEKISFVFWVPSIMSNVAKFDVIGNENLPELRKVLFAGEVMPPHTLNYWRKRLTNRTFANLYGPTEITVDCTFHICGSSEESGPIPIGRPCRNTDVIILTKENKLAKTGEHGELCVRGSSLALGYWRDCEKTEKVFCQNPLNDRYKDLIYRTGDLVYENSSRDIIYVGRMDSQIKLGGYRIELGEIEAAALRLEGGAQCCVVFDQEKQILHMFVELAVTYTLLEFKKQLMLELPKYMVPSKIYFVKKMPMTPNDKIDRVKVKTALTDEKIKSEVMGG